MGSVWARTGEAAGSLEGILSGALLLHPHSGGLRAGILIEDPQACAWGYPISPALRALQADSLTSGHATFPPGEENGDDDGNGADPPAEDDA